MFRPILLILIIALSVPASLQVKAMNADDIGSKSKTIEAKQVNLRTRDNSSYSSINGYGESLGELVKRKLQLEWLFSCEPTAEPTLYPTEAPSHKPSAGDGNDGGDPVGCPFCKAGSPLP